MPLVLGVTGSIAAGKSLVCNHLVGHYGATHVDADREIHQLYAPGTPGFDRVTAAFGNDIVGADGVIDRKILGSKVFGNQERMEALRTAIGDIPAHFMAMLERWHNELPADSIAIFEAINLLDRPLVVTYLMFTVTLIVLINLCVDLCYAVVDPRARVGQ